LLAEQQDYFKNEALMFRFLPTADIEPEEEVLLRRAAFPGKR